MEFTAAILNNGILSHYLISSADKINFIARLINFAHHTNINMPRVISLKKIGRWKSDCDEEITKDLGSHIDMKLKDDQRNEDSIRP